MTPTKVVHIKVTSEHIERGAENEIGKRSRSCPLALAISETIGRRFEVGSLNYWPSGKQRGRQVPLPVKSRRFAFDLDRGMTRRPIEFDLEVPLNWFRKAKKGNHLIGSP